MPLGFGSNDKKDGTKVRMDNAVQPLKLTVDEKEILRLLASREDIGRDVDSGDKFHVFRETMKQLLAKHLITSQSGIYEHGDWELTDMGLCYAVVQANASFSQYLSSNQVASKQWDAEVGQKRQSLKTDHAFDAFYYATFAKYIEYGWFDPDNNYSISTPADAKSQQRFAIETLLMLNENDKFPITNALDSIGLPEGLIKKFVGDDRRSLKYALEMMLRFL